uniref:DUF7619 domain-containing protein n=1 Tax=Flavobacterium sp. TaxID=239 RepID=UPI003750636F
LPCQSDSSTATITIVNQNNCNPSSCLVPNNLSASNLSSNAVNLSWTETGSATSWEVLVLTCGSSTPTAMTSGFATTSSNPFIFNGLNSNTCYSFYVRSVCSSQNKSDWSIPLSITTPTLPNGCGGFFTDNGGVNSNYLNNSDTTTTICTDNAGDILTINFTEFNIESGFDALYVYDGFSINSPQISSGNSAFNVPGGISGGFWGNVIPGPFTSSNPEGCLTFRFVSNASVSSSGWISNINCNPTDCTINGQCENSLSLIAFLDSNNNGIKDTDDTVFNNGNFLYTINNGSTQYYGYSNSGNYSIFSNNPSNSYNLSFVLNSNLVGYYNSNATYNNISIAPNSGITEYFFPISVLQVYNDLEVQLIANNNPIPGFTYSNTIIYKNNGAQNINSGTLTFTKDNNVILNSISQSGTTALSNGFSYNFTNLAPFEQRSIYIEMQVPTIPTISLGTLLTNSVTIEPLSDVIPTNNSSSLTQTVIGSYDPNDKTESHGEKIVVSNFSSNDYLTYTIRFENTGTANTQFIRIEDLLDASLNANSVEVLNASHPFNFRRENNKLIWNFYAISLPPTSINNQLSQGFVQFRVKPNVGYSIGDVIPNFANIYFDYNPAIITNTFNTEFVAALANANFNTGDFNLFPNPATNSVQIKLSNDNFSLKNIVIYDMIGKTIKSISNLNSNETIVDISNFSKGMYLVEITNDNLLKEVKKLIVE